MKGLVLPLGFVVVSSAVAPLQGCSSSSSSGGGGDSGTEGGAGSGADLGGSSGGSSGGSGAGVGSSGESSGGSGGSSGASSSGSSSSSSGSSSGSSNGSSGSSSGAADAGCASPAAAVANPCTSLVGSCVASNPSPGDVYCTEFYGPLFAATGGQAQCASSTHTYMAGVTCAQALPGGVNVGCATMPGDSSCAISYYPCLATCETCNVSSSTCVVP